MPVEAKPPMIFEMPKLPINPNDRLNLNSGDLACGCGVPLGRFRVNTCTPTVIFDTRMETKEGQVIENDGEQAVIGLMNFDGGDNFVDWGFVQTAKLRTMSDGQERLTCTVHGGDFVVEVDPEKLIPIPDDVWTKNEVLKFGGAVVLCAGVVAYEINSRKKRKFVSTKIINGENSNTCNTLSKNKLTKFIDTEIESIKNRHRNY